MCSCRSGPVLLLLFVERVPGWKMRITNAPLAPFKRATYPSDALTDRLTVLLNEMDTKSRLRVLQK